MQFLCSDGLLLPLVYDAFDAQGDAHGASGLSMVCEFMVDWKQESARWIDAVLAKAIAESDQNRNLIAGWFAAWEPRVAEALKPLAEKVLGAAGFEALADLRRTLAERAQRLGIGDGQEPILVGLHSLRHNFGQFLGDHTDAAIATIYALE